MNDGNIEIELHAKTGEEWKKRVKPLRWSCPVTVRITRTWTTLAMRRRFKHPISQCQHKMELNDDEKGGTMYCRVDIVEMISGSRTWQLQLQSIDL